MAGATCDSLSALKLAATTITAAQTVEAGAFAPPSGTAGARFKGLPAFCRVQGVIAPTQDSHIEFEVWLPAAATWNGRYMGIGNGGFAGSIFVSGAGPGARGRVRGFEHRYRSQGRGDEWRMGARPLREDCRLRPPRHS